jgi:hypothetical protein
MFSALLDRIGITGAVITADAMNARRAHATYMAGRGAHYLITVKGNQPGLHGQLAAPPWRQIPSLTTPAKKGTAAVSAAPSRSPPSPSGWPSRTRPKPSRSSAAGG